MTATRRVRAISQPAVDQAAPVSLPEAEAIKALAYGRASEHQQLVAWQFITQRAGPVQAQSFRANDAIGMAFMEGRRFVGSQLITIAAIDIKLVKDDT